MAAPVSLLLYERPAQSTTAFIGDLTPVIHDWRRTTRAMGGFWKGDFSITEADMSGNDMINFFTWNIGRRIVERTYGETISWEGEIVEMDFTYRGLTYRRTLDPEKWHNKVKVSYRDSTTKTSTATDWASTAISQAMLGDSEYIDVVGDNYDSTSAEALRDRHLTKYAWPAPRPLEGFSYGTGMGLGRGNEIRVLCAGYVMTMNRRFRESDTAADDASTQIATLVGESEFVTAGDIDANTLQVPITGSEIAFKLWDGIEDMIEMGDASGNRWVGGVYGGRVFDYHLAETAITHYWKDGRLLDRAMQPIIAPSLIKPDIIVRISETPFQTYQTGGNVSDSAMNAYVDEVEFMMPDAYTLTLAEL